MANAIKASTALQSLLRKFDIPSDNADVSKIRKFIQDNDENKPTDEGITRAKAKGEVLASVTFSSKQERDEFLKRVGR